MNRPRKAHPIKYSDVIQYDLNHALTNLEFGLRFAPVNLRRVKVKSSLTTPGAKEVEIDAKLPKDYFLRATVTLVPRGDRTELNVAGTSDFPFANLFVG